MTAREYRQKSGTIICIVGLSLFVLVLVVVRVDAYAVKLSAYQKQRISGIVAICDPAYTYRRRLGKHGMLDSFTVCRTMTLYANYAAFCRGDLNGIALVVPKRRGNYFLYSKSQTFGIIWSLYGSRSFDCGGIEVRGSACLYKNLIGKPKTFTSVIRGAVVSSNKSVKVYVIAYDNRIICKPVAARFMMILRPSKNQFGYYISSVKRYD